MARDPFSFWIPLDTAFLESLVKASHLMKTEFTVAQWSRYFFYYLNYAEAGGLTPGQQTTASIGWSTHNMMRSIFTSTATAYSAAIK